MVEVAGEYGLILALATVIVESIIVVLLYRTVRDYAEVAKLSRIEVRQRFRPWVGPAGGIEFLKTVGGKHQYVVTIRNYGEIPASGVTGMSLAGLEMPTREMVKGDKLSKFDLGPLLPSMEKRYWIFVDAQLVERAKNENREIYTIIYFLYTLGAAIKSGYGMISRLDPKTNTFVHAEMWVDQTL